MNCAFDSFLNTWHLERRQALITAKRLDHVDTIVGCDAGYLVTNINGG